MDSIVAMMGVAIGSAALVTIACSFYHAKKASAAAVRIAALEVEASEHRKEIHKLEAAHLKAMNELELEHHILAKKARDEHYSEGFQHGLASSQKDHLIEITKLRAAHREELAERETQAEKHGRAVARQEHEAQVKAFGVEIRPYVKIEKNSGVFRDSHKSYTGYQYQLLVNGIPAFQPHLVIEHTEDVKVVDKQVVADLVKLAHKAADAAANIYLGGASQGALTIGPEIVKQITV